MKATILAALIATLPLAAPAADVEPLAPTALIQSAFARTLNYASLRSVRMRILRNGRFVTHRSFDVAYKEIGEHGHTLVRFTEPDYLRGDAVLIIETPDRGNLAWLYMGEMRRTRRFSAAQKGDAFFGSDLTYEDLEHHDWRRNENRRLPDGIHEGRACYVVESVPTERSQYARIHAWIEKDRRALLRVDFYRGDGDRPIKSYLLDPDDIVEEDGVLKPRKIRVEQHGRDAATEIEFTRIEAGSEISDEIFSAALLEREGGDLYEMVRRLSQVAEENP